MQILWDSPVPFYRAHHFIRKIELSQIKNKIETLATFLPDQVLQKNFGTDSIDEDPYVGVLLYVNIMGVTKLIEKFSDFNGSDVDNITAILNAYLGAVVEIIYYYGGDVIKMGGEGCLIKWKILADESLSDILHLVTTCALLISEKFEHFNSGLKLSLRIKQSISCGNMKLGILGEDYKTIVVISDCMDELRKIDNEAKTGCIYVSKGAWSQMMQERYEAEITTLGHVKIIPGKILYKPNEVETQLFYTTKLEEASILANIHYDHIIMLQEMKSKEVTLTETKAMKELANKIIPRKWVKRAPAIWNICDLRFFITENIQNHVDENQLVEYLRQIRMITVQNIRILPDLSNTMAFVELWEVVFQTIWRIIEKVGGMIIKVTNYCEMNIVVVFGLRGVNYEMGAYNSLKTGYKIHKKLRQFNGIKNVSVGIGNGFAYCGVVGHPMRRAFNVMGRIVSRTSKISQKFGDKVACDYRTFKTSKLPSLYFKIINERILKKRDYSTLFFEYNEQFEDSREVQLFNVHLLGRSQELLDMQIKLTQRDQFAVCIKGNPKVGKSIFLEHLCKYAVSTEAFSVASLLLDESSLAPYFTISKIYSQFYNLTSRTIEAGEKLEFIPRELWDPHAPNKQEEIGFKKCRILNIFGDIIKLSSNLPCVIFLDNAEFIDRLSWEILELSLTSFQNFRLFFTGDHEMYSWKLNHLITANSRIETFILKPLPNQVLPALIKTFTNCSAIDKRLVEIVQKLWKGCAGLAQICLLKFFNKEEVLLINTEWESKDEFIYIEQPCPIVIGICLTSKHPITNAASEESNLNEITTDFLQSFNPFDQLVIKTASVLGSVFTRTLLIMALQYPSLETVNTCIRKLFEVHIFDCGSKYVLGGPISSDIFCCCWHDGEKHNKGKIDYGKCKIIHFKSKTIKQVAYKQVPKNQLKELHILCTEVIENLDHICPRCLKDPYNSFVITTKYKDILNYVEADDKLSLQNLDCGDFSRLKYVIRSHISADRYSNEKNNVTDSLEKYLFNAKECNCFEILLYVFRQLIYHSREAKLLSKMIYFTYQYGLILLCKQDITKAIVIFREAREYCTVDPKIGNAQISESFRKFLIAKLSCSLASACLTLRQFNQSKNHIIIALRQYNIPSLTFSYKHCWWLLNRSLFTNLRTIRPSNINHRRVNWEIGIILAICAKIFASEGNYKLAKNCSKRSICLLKRANPSTALLLDIYCTAIEIYRYSDKEEKFYKLQRYVTKELLSAYCNNTAFNISYVSDLLNVVFEELCRRGHIKESLRLGYRIVDFTMKVYMYVYNYDIFLWLAQLMIFTLNVKDFFYLANILKGELYAEKKVWYYVLSLLLFMKTGFSILPHQLCMSAIDDFLKNKPQEALNFEERYIKSLALIHASHMNELFNQYKDYISFNESNLKRPIMMRIMLNTIEFEILDLLKLKRIKYDFSREAKSLQKRFNLAKECISKLPILKPRYYSLLAWHYGVLGNKKMSDKMLMKCLKISESQENRYFVCLVRHLKNVWAGAYAPQYRDRRLIHVINTFNWSEDKITKYFPNYPLD